MVLPLIVFNLANHKARHEKKQILKKIFINNLVCLRIFLVIFSFLWTY